MSANAIPTAAIIANAATPWMTNCPSSVSASAHRPPAVQYTSVTTAVMTMPHTSGTPTNSCSSRAIADHFAATSKTFSSDPLHASTCCVVTLNRRARYSSGEAMP